MAILVAPSAAARGSLMSNASETERTENTLMFTLSCKECSRDAKPFLVETMTCTTNAGSLALFSDLDLIRSTLEGQTDSFTALMDRHLGAN